MLIITLMNAIASIVLAMVALKLLPFKSDKITGQYWIDTKDTKKQSRIHITLTNSAKRFDNVFLPRNGALITTDNDSQYLTLKSDSEEYIIAHGTSRTLSINTPTNAKAMKFLLANPHHKLYIFLQNNKRIELTHNKQKEVIK